jgi:heptosyltransferase-2
MGHAPRSGPPPKPWSPTGFAAVAAAASRLGLRPVLLGSPDERELCEAVALGSGVRPPVLAGRLEVAGMVALIERARALVANDSGPGHVASAVGTPVVTIYGPTSPEHGCAPWGDDHRAVAIDGLACRPCSRRGPRACPLGHFRCMRELAVPRVLAAVEALLEGPRLVRATQPGPALRIRRPG